MSDVSSGCAWLVPLHLRNAPRIRVPAGGTTLGRNGNCDIIIDKETISGQHFFVGRTSRGFWMLEDLSINGTLVGKSLVGRGSAKILEEGDYLSILDARGHHRGTFRFTLAPLLLAPRSPGSHATTKRTPKRKAGALDEERRSRRNAFEDDRRDRLQRYTARWGRTNHHAPTCVKGHPVRGAFAGAPPKGERAEAVAVPGAAEALVVPTASEVLEPTLLEPTLLEPEVLVVPTASELFAEIRKA